MGGCTFDGHFDILKEGVHLDIDSVDRTHNYGAVLELDRDRLVLELHEEPYQLHSLNYKS